jgi:hypothetical protein
MCWKCDSIEVKEAPVQKKTSVDTWYWFGVLGLGFMLVSVLSFAVGFFSR